MQASIAIVVIAYNRPKALLRLLTSLGQATYPATTDIPLFISVDSGGDPNVLRIAQHFEWKFGKKIVLPQTEKLGLKNHVLKCGDLVENYDALIMLEDDIFVAPGFFSYSTQAVDFYSSSPKIAGISLYNHELNVFKREPFLPQREDSDVYFLQMVSSWGQVFLKRDWLKFREWLRRGIDVKSVDVPPQMKLWPDTSWLKHYCAYIVSHDLFFVYPHDSLTSNFNDAGTHVLIKSLTFQTKLCHHSRNSFRFKEISQSESVYDAYYESLYIKKILEEKFQRKVCIDFYSNKTAGNDELIYTSSLLPYKCIESYELSLKPHENCVLFGLKGDGLYIYEPASGVKLPLRAKISQRIRRTLYLFKEVTREHLKSLLLREIMNRLL